MIFLPIGFDDGTVNRVPWVSIGIAGTCVLAFLSTWVFAADTAANLDEQMHDTVEYWADHPYLEPTPEFHKKYENPKMREAIDRLRKKAEDLKHVPSDEDREHEQKYLTLKMDAFLQAAEGQTLRKLSLVPGRGVKQVGWLTHLFLHFGWMHLLGNLLFLYIVGPFLEDVWGRPVFAAFYLIGGAVAAYGQYSLDPDSQAMVLGASGAIAACMGAFTVRFARRKIRLWYFIWIMRVFVGTVLLPAWICGLGWFADQLVDFLLYGSSAGIAFMAHLGGFGFGLVFALVLRATGVEEKYLTPHVERAQGEVWQQHPALGRAHAALEAGDAQGARAAFREVIAANPSDPEATLGLARLDLEAGETASGMQHMERFFARNLGRDDVASIRAAIHEFGTLFTPGQLRPGLAFQVAQALEQEGPGNEFLAEPLYAAAAAAGGALASKGLLRAAELAHEARPKEAKQYLEKLAATGPLPADLEARREAVVARVRAPQEGPQWAHDPSLIEARDPGGPGVDMDEPAPPADPEEPVAARAPPAPLQDLSSSPPRVTACKLLGLSPEGMAVESPARRFSVPFRRVLGVAVGRVPLAGQRTTLVTDLVVDWGVEGKGVAVLRFAAGALKLSELYPGMPPPAAYAQLLAHVLEQSGAMILPDRDAIAAGNYMQYADLAAFETACYGVSA